MHTHVHTFAMNNSIVVGNNSCFIGPNQVVKPNQPFMDQLFELTVS